MSDNRRPTISLSPEAPLSNTVRLARQGKPIPALVADPMTFSVPSTSRAYNDDSDSERPVGKRRKRGTTTAQQLAELEREFLADQHPNSAHRRKLATALGLPVRQTQVWFQNRRAKEKTTRMKALQEASNEIPRPPKTPPPLGEGSVPRLETMLQEVDPVLIMPSESLTIESWTRVKSNSEPYSLISYYCETRSSFTWFIPHEDYSFKMELFSNNVKNMELTNVGPGRGALVVELARRPSFYMQFRMSDGSRQWRLCRDWTSDSAASKCLVHQLEGSASQLHAVMLRFQKRSNGCTLSSLSTLDDDLPLDVPYPPRYVPSMGGSQTCTPHQASPSASSHPNPIPSFDGYPVPLSRTCATGTDRTACLARAEPFQYPEAPPQASAQIGIVRSSLTHEAANSASPSIHSAPEGIYISAPDTSPSHDPPASTMMSTDAYQQWQGHPVPQNHGQYDRMAYPPYPQAYSQPVAPQHVASMRSEEHGSHASQSRHLDYRLDARYSHEPSTSASNRLQQAQRQGHSTSTGHGVHQVQAQTQSHNVRAAPDRLPVHHALTPLPSDVTAYANRGNWSSSELQHAGAVPPSTSSATHHTTSMESATSGGLHPLNYQGFPAYADSHPTSTLHRENTPHNVRADDHATGLLHSAHETISESYYTGHSHRTTQSQVGSYDDTYSTNQYSGNTSWNSPSSYSFAATPDMIETLQQSLAFPGSGVAPDMASLRSRASHLQPWVAADTRPSALPSVLPPVGTTDQRSPTEEEDPEQHRHSASHYAIGTGSGRDMKMSANTPQASYPSEQSMIPPAASPETQTYDAKHGGAHYVGHDLGTVQSGYPMGAPGYHYVNGVQYVMPAYADWACT